MNSDSTPIGPLLQAWRSKRGLSQLALALDVGISARHLSFAETGRSKPSADVVLRIAERLDVPLRQRNELLLALGFAPRFPEGRLGSPDLAAANDAITRLLAAHDPYPGVALDRHWNIVLANAAAQRMSDLLPPAFTAPCINIFRASLHPEGFARYTTNFDAWARYLLSVLDRLTAATADPELDTLATEVRAYPNVAGLLNRPAGWRDTPAAGHLIVPCDLEVHGMRLSLFTTLLSFGTPRDVTLDELTIELFYPNDEVTATALRAAASA
jgi:transcriptional regulator with XRE-family HTH domain